MRKKVLTTGIALSVFILVSCGSSNKNEADSTLVTGTTESAIHGGDRSNFLDVDGKHKGILPCADCESIETKIILKTDNVFIRHSAYLGKDSKVFEENGSYARNSKGSKLILSCIINAPNQYFVSENKLIQPDREGNKITGNRTERYILRK